MYIRHPLDERSTVWLSFLVFYSRLCLMTVLALTVNDNIPDNNSIISPPLTTPHHHHIINLSLPNPPHHPLPPPHRRPLSHNTHHITFKTRDRDRRDYPIISAPPPARIPPTASPTIDDYFRPERSRRSVISKEPPSSSDDWPSAAPKRFPPTAIPMVSGGSEEPSAWSWATEEPSEEVSRICRPVDSCGKKGKSGKSGGGGGGKGGIRETRNRLRKKRPG